MWEVADKTIDWVAVALLGAMVGVGELVSRYRTAPGRAVRTSPAMLYLVINSAAALVALLVIRSFGLKFGVDANNRVALRLFQVMVAGLGAMAIFRSSIFTVRVGDRDVTVGPNLFLQVILFAADREVDRKGALRRSQVVSEVMKGISFSKAHVALPTYCLALMVNVSKEEQEQIGHQIQGLLSAAMDEEIKSLNLGLLLLSIVGEEVLVTAVEALRLEIST